VGQAIEQGFLQRTRDLALLLFVSLSLPIAASVYYSMGHVPSSDPTARSYSVFGGLITETSSLALLWYVISVQGRTWKDLGWNPEWADVPRAALLLLITRAGTYAVLLSFQRYYLLYHGHYLPSKSLGSTLGFGVTFLSIAFVCVNPFFEELIVRAFTMSEIVNLGGSPWLAIAVSVVAQMSYHLYQGLLRGIGLTILFVVFSIYYARSRKIVPVIIAHLVLDLSALLRGR
jgi:membrane protease YdiL (CAAX protease family)